MLERMIRQEVILYVMEILLLLGIIAKFISAFTVRRMVKAAGEIHKSNHKLMRLIKAKFEHASMVSDRVLNVGAFVDKYVYEYKVMGMRLYAWRAFPKKMLLIIGILGVFAVLESYRIEGMGDLALNYIQWTGLFVLLLVLLSFVTEDKTRLQAAKNYMIEYLENVCIHRYAKMNKTLEDTEELEEANPQEEEMREEVEQEEMYREEDVAGVSAQIAKELGEKQKKSEQEMRIRAILEEFLA